LLNTIREREELFCYYQNKQQQREECEAAWVKRKNDSVSLITVVRLKYTGTGNRNGIDW
jgi:hypothetical protein